MAKTKEELAEEARRKLLASDTPEGKAARAEEAAVKAATESYGAQNRGRPLKEYGRVTYPDDPNKPKPYSVAEIGGKIGDFFDETFSGPTSNYLKRTKNEKEAAGQDNKGRAAATALAIGSSVGSAISGAASGPVTDDNITGGSATSSVFGGVIPTPTSGGDDTSQPIAPNEFDKAEDFLKKARGRDRGMSEEVGNVMADVELAKAETGYGRESSAADPIAAIPAAGSAAAAAAAAAAGGDTPPDSSKGETLSVNGVLSTTTNKYFSEKPEAQDSNNKAPQFNPATLVTKDSQGNYVRDEDPKNIMMAQRGFNRNQRDMELRDRTDKRKDFAATLDAANYDPSTASSEDKAEFYAQGKELGLSSQQIDKYANDQLTQNAKSAAERTALSTRSGGAQGSSGGVSTEQSRKGVQGASSQVQDSASMVSEYSAGRGSSLRQESKRISKNPTPRERRAAAAAKAEEEKKKRNT